MQQDLLNSYNDAFQNGSLSVSHRRGVISLNPKADSGLSELSGWRPITLLNVDYKILAKTIAKRIEPFLPKLIHSDQTGFVKDRYIGQNIRLLSDPMEYTDVKKISGILLFIDFEKAFDSVEWKFIMNSLELFNFGPSIRKWFSTLCNNVETAVMNARYMTNYFQISRGVRQGCPLSPLCLLNCWPRKFGGNQIVVGVSLPNHKEAKISKFADDTTLISSDTEALRCSLQIVEQFGSISGLNLKKKKKRKQCGLVTPKRKILKSWNSAVPKSQLKYLEHICRTM